jgi:hypothetical protein
MNQKFQEHMPTMQQYRPWVMSASKTKPDDHFHLSRGDSDDDSIDTSFEESGDDSASSV